MERIDPKQLLKKTIPALCEQHVRPAAPDSDPGTDCAPQTGAAGGISANSWLSSAMALWLRDAHLTPSQATGQDIR